VFNEVRRVYRESMKPSDSLFNLYLARPLAAPMVVGFARTPMTPNQITFISLFTMLGAVAGYIAIPGLWGLWIGTALVELSYLFDCVDGQLARVTGRTSVVGGSLDFLMDELKAYLLVGALTARWYLEGGGPTAVYTGLAGLVAVGCALSMTKFVRSPEYAEATGAKALKHGEAAGAARAQGGLLWPLKAAIRAISQYPTTLFIFAAFGRMDLFLYAYGAVHALYVGQTGLVLILKLGRFGGESK
jgi:phosphatidylglycerophosphate synthase